MKNILFEYCLKVWGGKLENSSQAASLNVHNAEQARHTADVGGSNRWAQFDGAIPTGDYYSRRNNNGALLVISLDEQKKARNKSAAFTR